MSSRTVCPNCFAHPVSKERGRPHFPRRSVFVEMHSFKEARCMVNESQRLKNVSATTHAVRKLSSLL